MTALFLIPYPEVGTSNNLYRKFTSQINSASEVADEVYFTSYDSKNIYINKLGDAAYKKVIGKTLSKNQNFIKMHFIMKAVRKWVKAEKPNLVYMRVITPSWTYKRTLNAIRKNGGKVVVEIPTYPGKKESENSSRKGFYFVVHTVSKLFRNAYKNRVDLYALIGEKSDTYRNTPAINIENGLDVENVPMKPGFEEHEGELHIAVTAVFSYWHGYDRLIRGLTEYKGDKKVYVHLCGKSYDGTLDEIIKIAEDAGMGDRVISHGYLDNDALNEIFKKCDVAIGSLGLHRQDIIVDTTLKLPEYTARAIPFVFCTDSNNVDPNGKYYLKLQCNEDPVDINKIINFFDGLDKTTIQNEMRDYALSNLKWSTQFKKVVDFFD